MLGRAPSSSVRSEKSSLSSKNISKRTTFKTKNLLRKRNDLIVFHQDEDVTPKLLVPIETNPNAKHDVLSLSQLEIRSHYEVSFFGNMSHSVLHTLHTNLHTQSALFAATSQSYSTVANRDELENDSQTLPFSRSSESESEEAHVFYTPPVIMPKTVTIVLAETPVLYLLEITSSTEIKGTDEGYQTEIDNERYDYLTVGKGKNRKTTNAEIQTVINILKTRSTNARRPHHANEYTFASYWDMHDTYGAKEADTKLKKDVKAKLRDESHSNLGEEEDIRPEDVMMEELLKNPRFQKSVLIMERVLANNIYNQQQKRFRGLIEQDPFRPDIEFKYNLELLWTFKTPMVESHPVTSLQWHPYNTDILAAGYGKFYYSDTKPGIVYCWNVKNPKQPEREYRYTHPVTSVAFSQYEPNLLAVGLYDGTVSILDICKKNVEQLMVTKQHLTYSYEPIWQIEWFAPDGYNINEYHVICVCEDGRVCSFIATKTNDLIQVEMMKVFSTESKIKGVFKPKQCAANEIPILKTSAALTITKDPNEENIYFVGTGEGTLHKCSENYQNQHIDVIMAHSAAVYGMQFSHFCPKVFLTCGADACINIWIGDIKEPIATLCKSLSPVEGAEWCPANSTIIANISGNDIFLWDLQRKTYLPASEHTSPTGCRNTVIKFSPSGKNLIIGDIEGNIHVFTLTDLPFPPFYQAEMLEQVLYKSLITRKDLVEQIKRVGLCFKTGESAIY